MTYFALSSFRFARSNTNHLVLCQPQYILDNVKWKNSDTSTKWIWFQYLNFQAHSANQNYGGIFSLSPPNARVVMNGGELEASIFPPGYVSLVSNKFTYLLNLPDLCNRSSDISLGSLYPDAILCKVPLRSLKIYTRGLYSGSAPDFLMKMWYNKGGVQNQTGFPDASQIINFHQIGADNANPSKQGYSFPVIPSIHHSYRLSLEAENSSIPMDWVVEFSDFILGNKYGSIEYTNLSLDGFNCCNDGVVSSQHDRRYIWSGDQYMADEAWGDTGACAAEKVSDAR